MTGKIFGIGLSKTGTKSLQWALQQLGFRAAHFADHFRVRLGIKTWFIGDFETDCLANFDAAMDVPIPTFFTELDKRYPGSKFVLTSRDLESWLKSVQKHWTRNPLRNDPVGRYRMTLRVAMYGSHGYSEMRYRQVYDTHTRLIEWYFKDRPADLLVMDIIAGDGWEKLCPFLSLPVPEVPFPWANKATG